MWYIAKMILKGQLHVKHDNKPTDFGISHFKINPCLLNQVIQL